MYIWATTTPYMNRFSQGYLDYELSEWKLKLAILVVTFVTGALSMGLNGYIVAIFAISSHFRKLEYYPLALNCLVDMFGAGIVAIVAEYMDSTYSFNYDKGDWAFDGPLLRVIRKTYVKDYRVSCLLTHLRFLFTQYANPPCLLLLAIDRYVAVCWATRAKQIMTKTVRVVSCSLVTLLILAIFVAAPARTLHKYYSQNGYLDCDSMMYKDPKVRSLVDGIVFYLAPAVLCLVLYGRTGYVLMQSKGSKQIRNRNLTVAFILSNVFWIVCYIPQHVLTLYGNHIIDSNRDLLKQSKAYYIGSDLRHISYLAHSYVSPLLILFISRRFQEPFRRWWSRKVLPTLLGRKSRGDVVKTQSQTNPASYTDTNQTTKSSEEHRRPLQKSSMNDN
ncbi:atypical chemokine receptor 3-like [Symsagittifera roscoffensis]|uniref:atypical chemokine receptor 3-like n=1 Tax=Symsagittifera roscoffensis TaxID=84072 RepID=UPI00307B3575